MRVSALVLGHTILVAACAAVPINEIALDAAQGTRWQAVAIGGQPVLAEVQTVLAFDSSSTVSGDTGCNRFQGPVVAQDGGIRIGPLASTRRACPEGVMEQERRFTEALDNTRGLRIVGSHLELYDSGGQQLVRLSRLEERQ